jgi:transposase
MGKTYREWSPEQSYLFPASPRDWLPEDHLVWFLLDVVGQMDLRPFFEHYERELRGYPPFHPRMMVTLLLYCYATGTFSSRKIMARCQTDVALRAIVGEDIPDFRTISDFRKTHLSRLEGLFVEALRLCREAGLLKVGRVVLDGTKLKANASRHKAMSYGRMAKEEERLAAEIKDLLAQAEAADQAEDAAYGEKRGDELPAELARRESRLKRIREAKAALEAEAKAKAENPEAQPEEKAQYNFTDPESKIMKVSNKGFDQCGNAQVVANEEQIILAAEVTRQPSDSVHLAAMLDATCANLDAAGADEPLQEAVADAGYFSEANVAFLEEAEIEPFIATEKLKHNEKVQQAPRGRIPKGLTVKQRMARKLRTKRGRETYAQRKGIIEPIFGQIKQALGFRQFLLRGLAKMNGEWRLVCLVHNLLKVWRTEWAWAR